jgi:hypothetical protein
VFAAFGIARELLKDPKWVLTATAVYAFMPQMLYMSALFSNDISATSFATLAIWQSLRMVRLGLSTRRVITLGGLIGIAALAKVSALVVLPGALAAILLSAGMGKPDLRRLFRWWALLMLTVLALFGPWVIYGIVTFQDPLGLRPHTDPGRVPQVPSLMAYIGQLGPVFNSYWARIGTNAAWMNPVVYALFAIFVLLSVSGYIAYVRRHVGPLLSALQRKQAIVLTLVTVANGILFLYWLRAYYAVAFAVTGRLLYPVHGALVIAFVGGLSLLAHQIRGVLRQALPVGVMALMGSGLLLSPITLAAIYSLPQKLKVEDLPALRGGPIDFNQTARFLGYAERAPLIKQGVLHTFTLCWQVLHPSTESFA